MTRLPRSPGSRLVLRLYQETIHDFILLFMPPCGPHLTPLATGSLERSLLVFSTPGGLTGNDLFTLVLHLHQHESSRNPHLQYLAKNQSTQCCQSLITQGSDHPPVLKPHMVLKRAASLKISHFAGPEGNYEASPVRKRVRPPLLNVHMIQTPEHD
jgi:hypothetical protein